MKEKSKANRNENREHKERHEKYNDLPDRERRYSFLVKENKCVTVNLRKVKVVLLDRKCLYEEYLSRKK